MTAVLLLAERAVETGEGVCYSERLEENKRSNFGIADDGMERGNRSHNQALKQCNQLKMADISSRMNVILGT